MTKTTKQAIKRYGTEACLRAYELHRLAGFGAAGIAQNYALRNVTTTRAADAAINAGRELHAAKVA